MIDNKNASPKWGGIDNKEVAMNIRLLYNDIRGPATLIINPNHRLHIHRRILEATHPQSLHYPALIGH